MSAACLVIGVLLFEAYIAGMVWLSLLNRPTRIKCPNCAAVVQTWDGRTRAALRRDHLKACLA